MLIRLAFIYLCDAQQKNHSTCHCFLMQTTSYIGSGLVGLQEVSCLIRVGCHSVINDPHQLILNELLTIPPRTYLTRLTPKIRRQYTVYINLQSTRTFCKHHKIARNRRQRQGDWRRQEPQRTERAGTAILSMDSRSTPCGLITPILICSMQYALIKV